MGCIRCSDHSTPVRSPIVMWSESMRTHIYYSVDPGCYSSMSLAVPLLHLNLCFDHRVPPPFLSSPPLFLFLLTGYLSRRITRSPSLPLSPESTQQLKLINRVSQATLSLSLSLSLLTRAAAGDCEGTGGVHALQPSQIDCN